MPIDFDIAAAERTDAARALFGSLTDTGHANLVTLNGAELCILGGPKHPLFWEPLATSWHRSDPEPRNRMIEACTSMMVERGLLIEESPGGKGTSDSGYAPGTQFALSPELGITLAARCRPTFIISTHHTTRLPSVNLFAIGDEATPVRGIVVEIPDAVPGTREHAESMGPLGLLFYYTLHTPGSAAEFLADWTLRPSPAKRFQKQPPRKISLFRPGDGVTPTAELSVLGNGTTARVTGAGISGELDKETLRTVILGLFGRGSPTA
jgi:hypothetical protein